MIIPLMMSMYATNLAYDSASTMFGVNQAHMGLANSATGDASQIPSLAAQDKALRFAGIQAETNYLAAMAIQGQASEMMKRDREQKQRMQSNGAVFF